MATLRTLTIRGQTYITDGSQTDENALETLTALMGPELLATSRFIFKVNGSYYTPRAACHAAVGPFAKCAQ